MKNYWAFFAIPLVQVTLSAVLTSQNGKGRYQKPPSNRLQSPKILDQFSVRSSSSNENSLSNDDIAKIIQSRKVQAVRKSDRKNRAIPKTRNDKNGTSDFTIKNGLILRTSDDKMIGAITKIIADRGIPIKIESSGIPSIKKSPNIKVNTSKDVRTGNRSVTGSSPKTKKTFDGPRIDVGNGISIPTKGFMIKRVNDKVVEARKSINRGIVASGYGVTNSGYYECSRTANLSGYPAKFVENISNTEGLVNDPQNIGYLVHYSRDGRKWRTKNKNIIQKVLDGDESIIDDCGYTEYNSDNGILSWSKNEGIIENGKFVTESTHIIDHGNYFEYNWYGSRMTWSKHASGVNFAYDDIVTSSESTSAESFSSESASSESVSMSLSE